MFKFIRDVMVKGQKVGQIEVVFDTPGVTINSTDESTGELEALHLSFEAAEILHDLMNLARVTHDGGQPY